MNFILLKFKSNHTPDAIGNCINSRARILHLRHPLQTTQSISTEPQFDHKRLKPATGLVFGGVGA